MTQHRIKELSCLCGARERDEGQARPRLCWSCGCNTMGRFSMTNIAQSYWRVIG